MKLDLDEIERLAKSAFTRKPSMILRDTVPALVTEVRRLRAQLDDVTTDNLLAEARDEIEDLRGERDAARAEAERCRENATTGNDVYRKLVDALGFGWNEPDGEHEVAWVDSEDVEHQAMLLRTEASRVREALQAVREIHSMGRCGCDPNLPHSTGHCRVCGIMAGWPCSTVRALDAALGGAE